MGEETAITKSSRGNCFRLFIDYIKTGQVFEGALIAIIPIVVVYFLAQKYIAADMTAGTIKIN